MKKEKITTYMPEGQTATLLLNWKMRTDVNCSGHKARGEMVSIMQKTIDKAERLIYTKSSHWGGQNTKQLAVSGFKGFFVMHIPLATFPSTNSMPESDKPICWEHGETWASSNGSMNDGARMSWWPNNSWPETNFTPL